MYVGINKCAEAEMMITGSTKRTVDWCFGKSISGSSRKDFASVFVVEQHQTTFSKEDNKEVRT